jgi:hypothetical protein
MDVTVEPISGEDVVGYVCAMICDLPWGEPQMASNDPDPSGSQ